MTSLREAERLTTVIDSLEQAGDLPAALSCAQQQLALRREALGDDHLDVAASLMRLATVAASYADSSVSLPDLLREALTIRRRHLQDPHPDLALTMSAIALHGVTGVGDLDSLAAAALAMSRACEDAPLALVRSLVAHGVRRQIQGDYLGAETLLREALAKSRQAFGADDLTTADVHRLLAGCLHNKGDYPASEKQYRGALSILEKRLPPNHIAVVRGYNGLGVIHLSSAGDKTIAEQCLREALARYQMMGFENPSTQGALLHNLGVAVHCQGRIEEAHQCFLGARETYLRILPETPASVLAHLATLNHDLGNYELSDSLQTRVVEIRRREFPPEASPLLIHMNSLGHCKFVLGRYAEAESILVEAAAAFETARLRRGMGLARARTQGSPYELLAATLLMRGKTEQAWPALERGQSRALVDALLARARKSWFETASSADDSLPGLVADLRRSLSVSEYSGVPDTTAALHELLEMARNRLLAAETDWLTLQQEIARQTEHYRSEVFDLARVQATLQPDEAIIGWLSDELLYSEGEMRTWGYVIRARGPVHWRCMPIRCDSALCGTPFVDYDPAVSALRSAIVRAPQLPVPWIELARAVWTERIAPLADCLVGVRRIVVIPSDVMTVIPIEVLPWQSSDELLGDRFEVSYAPSATVHAWLREQTSRESVARENAVRGKPARCLVVADPPFRATEAPIAQGLHDPISGPEESGLFVLGQVDGNPKEQQEEELFRSALAGSRSALASLRQLPWSRVEAEALGRMYGESACLLVGAAANRDTLIGMAQDDLLREFERLHFATHALIDDLRPERCALVLSQRELPDPLEALANGEDVHNGCLISGEIMDTWRLDADLVVLSGCGTALGSKVQAEGHIGLAHAFLLAGARNLVLSFWNVEDRAAALLMERFHANLLESEGSAVAIGDHQAVPRITALNCGSAQRASKVAALQAAKQWLREWRDADGRRPYAHPFYWAGFVLMGGDR